MKKLLDYLQESKKTYQFIIGMAGDLPEDIDNRIQNAMEKFSLVDIGKSKKTPIQEQPLDFPNLNNTEVTYWDVTVRYPTTEAVIKNYLGQFCSVIESKIVVKNPNVPSEKDKNKKESDVYEPLLSKTELGGESAQQSVGNNRVMELLKELETARKERDNDFKMETVKDIPQNNKSALGSK